MKQIYYDKGEIGNNKYTFEVYQLDDGTYKAFVRRWDRRLNRVKDESVFIAVTREALREQNYPKVRQVKIFLNSNFWTHQNEQD
ncbi:sugar ABC transporter substrate-binding protein [Xenorhabdus bovienii]|uniref:sugar ABC transporter substrate-binding protein n=1 Tax=Xenorhabdus bovienii TaxID=40576 RepID=UPI0023B29BD3|nr:sugar ABC transporter substrate-binding protein [Xenorhabdus bovienii]MDE9429932.1 sugar ABC transporter substrate-binding protein [Xenorhabdus bovienii]